MKRAAWLASLVAVVALASAGCTFQVAGQGQDGQQVGSTSQGLGQGQTGAAPASTTAGTTADDGSGSGQQAVGAATKPTPDPWRNGLVSPAKPTPDPWRPGDSTSSGSDGTQGTSSTSTATQSGATHAALR